MYAYSRNTEFDDTVYARSRVADLIDSVDPSSLFRFLSIVVFLFLLQSFSLCLSFTDGERALRKEQHETERISTGK